MKENYKKKLRQIFKVLASECKDAIFKGGSLLIVLYESSRWSSDIDISFRFKDGDFNFLIEKIAEITKTLNKYFPETKVELHDYNNEPFLQLDVLFSDGDIVEIQISKNPFDSYNSSKYYKKSKIDEINFYQVMDEKIISDKLWIAIEIGDVRKDKMSNVIYDIWRVLEFNYWKIDKELFKEIFNERKKLMYEFYCISKYSNREYFKVQCNKMEKLNRMNLFEFKNTYTVIFENQTFSNMQKNLETRMLNSNHVMTKKDYNAVVDFVKDIFN